MLRRHGAAREPLVLLLHGNGSDEDDIAPLAAAFPAGIPVATLRAPIASDGAFRWYAHHDVGRPVAASLAGTIAYVRGWLDANGAGRVALVGFSGGALTAGALMLHEPERFAVTAMLHGPLPFAAGVDTSAGRLAGCEVFYGYGERDDVIPRELIARTRAYLRDDSGARVDMHGYAAAHEIVPDEAADLGRWLAARVS